MGATAFPLGDSAQSLAVGVDEAAGLGMNTDSKRGVPFPALTDQVFFQERNCQGCAFAPGCVLLGIAARNARIPDAWVKEPVSYRCTEFVSPEGHRRALRVADAAHVAEMQGGLF